MKYIKTTPDILTMFYLVCLGSSTFISCVSNRESTANSGSDSTHSTGLIAKTDLPHYFVFHDGAYAEIDPDSLEIESQYDMFQKMFYSIKYPAFAREHGIQGTVLITVIINEFGQLEDAYVSRSVGGGCDEEALRVIRLAGQNGLEPAKRNGIPVKVKYEIPLKFTLS